LLKFTNFAKKNGRMSLADFSKYLQLPPTGAVNQVFNMYDRDKDGHIDFREFLIGLSLLSQPASTEDTLKLAFKMFDSDGKGFISLTDLKSILYSALSMAPNEVEQLFHQIDTKNKHEITLDEFKSYIEQKPEYAKIFLVYNEIQMLRNNIEIEKIATSASSASKEEATPSSLSSPTKSDSNNNNNNNKNVIVVDSDKTNYAKPINHDEMTTIKRAKSRTDDDVLVEDVSNENTNGNSGNNDDDDNLRKKSSTPSDDTSKTE
jgi:Ca2+-binding EF-hand superfamily protein